MRTYRVLISLALAALTLAIPLAATAGPQPKTVKNVILLIGDGMGLAHIKLAQLVYGHLAMEKFSTIGILYTDSLSGEVTDSAAAATAIATGFKTLNGMLGLVPTPAGNVSVMTILELAKKLGKSVGLVTTTRITHATPAGFAAHVPHRHMEKEIAVQLIERGVDVLMGGGKKYFPDELIEKAKKMGYTVVTTRSELLALKGATKVLGLFAYSHMPFVLDRGPEVPSLVEMTKKAIEILERNPEGFFLMVEGGRIDHAAHANDVASVVAETKEFDDVVGYVLDYAMKRGDTLVIVVADHETGGLAVGGYAYGDAVNETLIKSIKASCEKMAEEITAGGDVREVIKKYTGLTLTDEEVAEIEKAVEEYKAGNRYAVSNKIAEIISKRAGVAWASHKHTGEPVVILAYGPGAELFAGFHHHTDIPKLIARLMLFGLEVPEGAVLTLKPSPVPGDVNGDYVLDYRDAYVILGFVGEYVDTMIEKKMDLNKNGLVDLEDVYLAYTGSFSTALEPAGLGLLTCD